jgi:hypothetical protein
MDADYSIELSGDDPVLDFPWTDPSGRLAYVDLKRHPELLSQVEEASLHPELAGFLRSVNSARGAFESAKCDAWATTEIAPEEEIFGASHKFASYVDVVFSEAADRRAFSRHEEFVKRLVALLAREPELASSAEACVRRCFFGEDGATREGLYVTVYVNGYGNDETAARKNWAIGLKLVKNAMAQLSTSVSRG